MPLIAANRAGIDIYCEKPLTLTVDKGKHVVRVARDTKRIPQTGSQQCSDRNVRLDEFFGDRVANGWLVRKLRKPRGCEAV